MSVYEKTTTDYNFSHFEHQGFGGVDKYIASPKSGTGSRLLIKHEEPNTACNEFLYSRLAELCGVYVPKAYMMDFRNDTRSLFSLPFIVGIEYVDDIQKLDFATVAKDQKYRSDFLQAMSFYALVSWFGDEPQFAYAPDKGIWAFDLEESFRATAFIIKVNLLSRDNAKILYQNILTDMESNPSVNTFFELALDAAMKRLQMKSRQEAYADYLKPLNRFCEANIEELSHAFETLNSYYPKELTAYYKDYLKILQRRVAEYLESIQ